jgi:hypothetical protein
MDIISILDMEKWWLQVMMDLTSAKAVKATQHAARRVAAGSRSMTVLVQPSICRNRLAGKR